MQYFIFPVLRPRDSALTALDWEPSAAVNHNVDLTLGTLRVGVAGANGNNAWNNLKRAEPVSRFSL